MKTGKNIATNNYITAMWSSHYYKENHKKSDNIFYGQVRNVRTGENEFFSNGAEYLSILQKWYRAEEKWRKSTNHTQYNPEKEKKQK